MEHSPATRVGSAGHPQRARAMTGDGRQELGEWQPARAVPFELAGPDGGPGEWRLRLAAWRPAHMHCKLVEWDPAARAVVAWERGPDRQLVLDARGPARLEPPATRLLF